MYWLQSLRTPWLDSFMAGITRLGDHGTFFILLGLLLAAVAGTRETGLRVLLSLFIGALIGNVLLKNMIGRERPCWIDQEIVLLVSNPHDYSFPSGHTLVSFETAVSVFLKNRKWGVLLLILAVLIAFSRLYLFVHFPTDVLTGILLGTAIALFVGKLPRRYFVKGS